MKNENTLEILTTEFRASHPHIFKPSAVRPGEKLNYSIEMIFDKKTTKLADFQAVIKNAAASKWGPDQKKWPSPLTLPYRDGDKPHGKKKEVKPEHKGNWIMKASSSAEYSGPQVVGKNPKIALTESEFYPGCYARATLKAHAYSFADKDGVKFILNAVQFIRDGDALGGKKPADQIFGMIDGGDEDDALSSFGNSTKVTEDSDEMTF